MKRPEHNELRTTTERRCWICNRWHRVTDETTLSEQVCPFRPGQSFLENKHPHRKRIIVCSLITGQFRSSVIHWKRPDTERINKCCLHYFKEITSKVWCDVCGNSIREATT